MLLAGKNIVTYGLLVLLRRVRIISQHCPGIHIEFFGAAIIRPLIAVKMPVPINTEEGSMGCCLPLSLPVL